MEWLPLARGWVSQISVAQNSDGRLEVFGIGGDGGLYNNYTLLGDFLQAYGALDYIVQAGASLVSGLPLALIHERPRRGVLGSPLAGRRSAHPRLGRCCSPRLSTRGSAQGTPRYLRPAYHYHYQGLAY